MAKDLEYYLSQARRISEHRERGAEKEIRKIYKAMLSDLQTFMSEAYVQYSQDDRLTYAMLQAAGYDARFLEEVEQRMNISTPKAQETIQELVEQTYKAAYTSMVDGVARATGMEDGLRTLFESSVAITPEQIKRAVQNPVYGLTLKDTLEKNRREIIYNIKQTVGVGLMNGDRYSTMARRIATSVDGDYKKAIRIARTEAHRTREGGNVDAAQSVDKELQNTTTGLRMVKIWKTMKDERVRPQRRRRGKKGGSSSKMGKGANHMVLDGQVVLADEVFDLKDGNTAMNPGNSGIAGHDINCRCYLSYDMLDDSEYYQKSGKHFPGWSGVVDNSSNSDTIVDEKLFPPELAGVKRGDPMTFEDADSGNVNPKYGESGYNINCQSCVVCFEARQRGYDVYTLPNKKGSTAQMVSHQTNIAWIDPATGTNPDYITDRTKAYTSKTYATYLDSIIEPGKRYTLEFGWKGRGHSGHIVNIDRNEKGELRIKDNQRGFIERLTRDSVGKLTSQRIEEKSEWIGSKEVSQYLGRIKYKGTVYGYEYYLTPKVLRVDDKQFNMDIVNKLLKGSLKK